MPAAFRRGAGRPGAPEASDAGAAGPDHHAGSGGPTGGAAIGPASGGEDAVLGVGAVGDSPAPAVGDGEESGAAQL